jgi:hypothetical protein
MSQQGPILVVANDARAPLVSALDAANLFPVIEVGFADAVRAVAQLEPAAIVAAMSVAPPAYFEALAEAVAAQALYLPLIAVAPKAALPENAIPFQPSGGKFDRLITRLSAALRVRALHATVLRRLADAPASIDPPKINPAHDATVLLAGRGGAYATLSVALGERTGVVGAFSIEAAANHLNTREIDGIVVAEGFTARVEDAFLTVLAEHPRFRSLPVVLTSGQLALTHDLPNLETLSGEPSDIATNTLPLVRQHAFDTQLSRTLQAIEAGGLLDPQTGLLTSEAFDRDFATAVAQTLAHGGGLSVARFGFDPRHPRARSDGARIISHLMRRMDFGAVQDDGSVLVVFCDTDQRSAHGIARRLSAVMRHTASGKRDLRSEPSVTIATLMPTDSPTSLLERLYENARRAVS